MQRTRKDPTVKSVRFVSENPEEKFFSTLKDFRFTDGGAFDFRGAKQYSTGASGETLSNSNERASKGFVSTMELNGKISVDRKSTRLNSSHGYISYAVFCLKKKN